MPIKDILAIVNAKLKVPMKIVFFRAWVMSGKCPFVVYVKQDGKERGMYYFFEERFNAYINGEDMKTKIKYEVK